MLGKTHTAAERYICQLTGAQSPSLAMKWLMSQLAKDAGIDKVPVDPMQVATNRRIHPTLLRQMSPAVGWLKVNENGFVIGVNSAPLSRTRERFTIAHEIAHTLFYDIQVSPPRYMGDGSRNEYCRVETLCDLGASHLLVPTNQLITYSKRMTYLSLLGLKELAELFGVSIQTCCIALERVNFWGMFGQQIIVLAGEKFVGEADGNLKARYVYIPWQFNRHLHIPDNIDLDQIGTILTKPIESFSNITRRRGAQKVTLPSDVGPINGTAQCIQSRQVPKFYLILIQPFLQANSSQTDG